MSQTTPGPAPAHQKTRTRTGVTRGREQLHFTASSGWINDPQGICWVKDRYHLFYQYNPQGPRWAAECQWGHAESTDLISWVDRPVALVPRAGERGCWSGCTIIQNGQPTIVYTSIETQDIGHGRITLAHPDADLTRWTSTDQDIIVDGPPADLGVQHFRDPYIFATDAGWTMIVGAGTGDGTALAVQYTSTDAQDWTYTGILCSREESQTDGVWTGAVWECPQLIRIGDDWALIVSVWQNHQVFYVAGAVGSYDGSTFVPERWGRLTHDDCCYAMTSFRDIQQRPCVMSWLREPTDHNADSSLWAGSLSLPAIIEITPERALSLTPHPNLAAHHGAPALHAGPATEITVPYPPTGGLDIELTLPTDGQTTLCLNQGDQQHARIVADAHTQTLLVERAGQPDSTLPMPSSNVRMVLDTDLIELYGGAGTAAFRINQLPTGTNLTIRGAPAHINIFTVSPRAAPMRSPSNDPRLGHLAGRT